MKQFKVGDRLRVIDNDMRKDQLKIGATCEVTHTENFGRSVKVKFDDPSNWTENFLYSDRFELCHRKSLDQDLALARTFLNKKVASCSSDTTFIVDIVRVYTKEDGAFHTSSPKVVLEVEKNGYCVALIGGIYQIPLSDAIESPTSKTVKLNDTYDAVVSKSEVTVGCQTFSIDKIRELIAAADAL